MYRRRRSHDQVRWGLPFMQILFRLEWLELRSQPLQDRCFLSLNYLPRVKMHMPLKFKEIDNFLHLI